MKNKTELYQHGETRNCFFRGQKSQEKPVLNANCRITKDAKIHTVHRLYKQRVS